MIWNCSSTNIFEMAVAERTNQMKDIIGKMMETLETTLTEIHQSTGKR